MTLSTEFDSQFGQWEPGITNQALKEYLYLETKKVGDSMVVVSFNGTESNFRRNLAFSAETFNWREFSRLLNLYNLQMAVDFEDGKFIPLVRKVVYKNHL